MASQEEFYTGRHVVYDLKAHLVFVTKYRKGCIDREVFEVLKESWEETCQRFECNLIESNFDLNHVHLVVSYPPKVQLSKLVNCLKGASSHRLRGKNLPQVKKTLWGKQFWSPSYFANSCGGAPLEIIKKYVRQQQQTAIPPRAEARGLLA